MKIRNQNFGIFRNRCNQCYSPKKKTSRVGVTPPVRKPVVLFNRPECPEGARALQRRLCTSGNLSISGGWPPVCHLRVHRSWRFIYFALYFVFFVLKLFGIRWNAWGLAIFNQGKQNVLLVFDVSLQKETWALLDGIKIANGRKRAKMRKGWLGGSRPGSFEFKGFPL